MNSLDDSVDIRPIYVITPTLNCRQLLQQNLESIDQCDYPALHQVIVDGGSSDGTCELVEARTGPHRRLVRAPGTGIYEAMNVGALQVPDNAFIVFINADDVAQPKWPAAELQAMMEEVDAIFCHVLRRNRLTGHVGLYRCWLPHRITVRTFLKFPVHHQGYAVSKHFFNQCPYQPALGIHADYHQMARVINAGRVRFWNGALEEFSTGGASDRFSLRNWRSLRSVCRGLGLSWWLALLLSPTHSLKMMIKISVGMQVAGIIRRWSEPLMFGKKS